MAVPTLSPEQRAQAAERATAARQRRAKLRAELKQGTMTVSEVLARARDDEAIAKLKVVSLLEALPGVGKTKAAVILERHRIAPSRRVRGLGPHQRASLLAELG